MPSASSSVHQGGRHPGGGNATLRAAHQGREPAPGRVALAMPVCQRGAVSVLGGLVPLSHSKAQEVQGPQAEGSAPAGPLLSATQGAK